MKKRLCVKRLTASDLTFFKWHFLNKNAGNQKAINLNADVFINTLYPELPDLAEDMSGHIPLDLTIFGPGHSKAYNLQRKIRKIVSYKNWRLNGEFVENPEGDLERFNILVPGDLAIMEFMGISYPNASNLFLISSISPEDTNLHQGLKKWLDNRKMASVDIPDLQQMVLNSSIDRAHPVNDLFSEFNTDLEDAALGSFEGIKRFKQKRPGRNISQEQFRKVRESAESVGRHGEEYLDLYFAWLVQKGELKQYKWISDINAISPFDFEIVNNKDIIDAKSTSGDFNRTIHVSCGELHTMAESESRYDIYRIFELSEKGAKLRIASDLKSFAQSVITNLQNLPQGVEIDSISVHPESLKFGTKKVLPSIEKLIGEE